MNPWGKFIILCLGLADCLYSAYWRLRLAPYDYKDQGVCRPMVEEQLYNELAKYYDVIDGKTEEQIKKDARQITQLISQFQSAEEDILLDVGCGTGRHLKYLERVFPCIGVDANKGVIDVAEEHTTSTEFREAEMERLQLDRTFGAIICLFSTIAYAETERGVRRTIEGFYEHLADGGVAIIEPYHSPAEYKLSERAHDDDV